jgi:hypothetical protein
VQFVIESQSWQDLSSNKTYIEGQPTQERSELHDKSGEQDLEDALKMYPPKQLRHYKLVEQVKHGYAQSKTHKEPFSLYPSAHTVHKVAESQVIQFEEQLLQVLFDK